MSLGSTISKTIWPFSPQSIPGCSLWLDAADTSTLTLSGSNVSNWKDKSGNGLVAGVNNSLGLPSFITTNGKSAVQFQLAQALRITGFNYTTAWSVFCCINSVTLGGRYFISPYSTKNIVMLSMGLPGGSKIWAVGLSGNDITGEHIESTVATNTNAGSGGNYDWYRDGGLISSVFAGNSVSASSSVPLGIGANESGNYNMDGTYNLYEVLIYNSVLTTSQRQQVEGYLAQKWSLQTNLPSTHPYYATSTMQLYKMPVFQRQFNPTDILGCSLWLDAADTSSMTFSSGTTLSGWKDKSGNQNNATTISGTPILTSNGALPTTVAFNSVSMTLTTVVNAPPTIFVVAKTNTAGGNNQAVLLSAPSSGSFANSYIIISSTNSGNVPIYYVVSPSSTIYQATSTFPGINQLYLLTGVYDTTNATSGLQINTNGATTGTPGAPGSSQLTATKSYVGNIDYYNGLSYPSATVNIAEMIVFNTVLTTSQRQQVESYLGWKWGLLSNLASGHPGKTLPAFSSVFNPKSISGMALWLDAADISTITVGTGSTISLWTDKSGNAYNAVTSTTASADANMSPAIYTTSPYTGASFDFTRQMAAPVPAGTFSTAFSGFVVFNFTGSVNNTLNYSILNRSGNGINAPFSEAQSNGTVFRAIGGGSGGTYSGIAGTPLTSTTQSIYYVNVESSANTTWNESVNGTLTVYSTAAAGYGSGGAAYADLMNYVNIGGRYDHAVGYSGIISEVICYNSTLTISQRQQVEGYLAWKWGIQSKLPSTHACYKSMP